MSINGKVTITLEKYAELLKAAERYYIIKNAVLDNEITDAIEEIDEEEAEELLKAIDEAEAE